MNDILFNISEKIDPGIVEVLRAIKQVADSLNIDFFVVGASARDLILEHCHNVIPSRRTKDIDIGVEVEDWDEYQKLSKALITTGKFVADTKEKQRFLFNDIPVSIFSLIPQSVSGLFPTFSVVEL